MTTISTEDLAEMLRDREALTLIMTMSETAFAMGHIPGSIYAERPEDLTGLVEPGARIVVYCTGKECAASSIAFRRMIAAGFRNVRHYTGGLAEWHANGLPIETVTLT